MSLSSKIETTIKRYFNIHDDSELLPPELIHDLVHYYNNDDHQHSIRLSNFPESRANVQVSRILFKHYVFHDDRPWRPSPTAIGLGYALVLAFKEYMLETVQTPPDLTPESWEEMFEEEGLVLQQQSDDLSWTLPSEDTIEEGLVLQQQSDDLSWTLPSEDTIEERRRETLDQQDRERTYVSPASEDDLQSYYQETFGSTYNDLTLQDVITLEEVKVKDYIAEDKDNIIFVIKTPSKPDVLFGSKRSVIANQMAIYDCDDDTKKYISLSNIGYHGTGATDYNAIKTTVLKSNYQIIRLRPSGDNTGKLIRHEVRHFGDSVVGNVHCQEGSQMPYYQTFVPP